MAPVATETAPAHEEILKAAPAKRGYHGADAPYAIPNDDSEWQRLTDMHTGLKAFLGGVNTKAPLGTPKDILELGAGSGIWAFEMAEQYPEAKVTAVDISPVNETHKPANCEFKQVNLMKDWPFEPESFDVVHMRFLLVHMPNWPQLAAKAASAVRPGGYLLLEDIDHHVYRENGPLPDGISKFYSVYHAHMGMTKVDADTGVKLQAWLEDSKLFGEVQCLEFHAPMMSYKSDETLNKVGEVMRISLTRAYASLHLRMGESGMTPEIIKAYADTIHDPDHWLYMPMFFTWARKTENTAHN
ncbi:S-adenosyl-L-methionine-dependent methyltransferase [Dacryopinax primogenitus]|uniref:S-adenosyl-L-methionine-dependent methyltransferase n=1 Tax=Dacryopinax primogenitus (strain DJM 731) TaxID=1858805 RepID=M5FVK2_DACPD|nr:S-adenosyl-L-methionine-dependent methyltransferase [Dacryopinax primogenitus]EJT99639.1 S-adenosyl-L-methionine-dependent methyltransferase [Dacryopinax primogenitus]